MKLSIIKCHGCGRLGVSVDEDDDSHGTRVTAHKCAGRWDTVESIHLSGKEWASLIEEAENYTDSASEGRT